jgi:acetate kinase
MAKILAVNAGSSSFKVHLYGIPAHRIPSEPTEPLWKADAAWSEVPGTAEVRIEVPDGGVEQARFPFRHPADCFEDLLAFLWKGATKVLEGPHEIDAVGHRVVHGGKTFVATVEVTPAIEAGLESLTDLAPVHNAMELQVLATLRRLFGPTTPQVAVFDTAFHSTLPRHVSTYPLPYEWLEWGIRRYGFHGISHQYVARRTATILGRPLETLRLVTCHLGNGCSLAAVAGGRSIDTTMGFTPVEGLMMGARSGSVDPGILVHVLRHRGIALDRLDDILNRESGLRGVSGTSSDMRQILAAVDAGNDRARLALEIYVHRLRSGIAAMVSSLQGLDVLAFTGGVGENAFAVRASVCEGLEYLGVSLEPERNLANPKDGDVATEGSRVRVLVVKTREEWEIARECARLLADRPIQAC